MSENSHYRISAMLNLLIKKGIITEEEFLKEYFQIKPQDYYETNDLERALNILKSTAETR